MEGKTKIMTAGSGIIVTILVATFLFQYSVQPQETTLYRNGSVMFRERWYVHAERTYINLDSWYDKNVKCPRIIEQGGRRTEKRCYYPENFYENTARSLKNTEITYYPKDKYLRELGFKPYAFGNNSLITKRVPYYAYGTKGSYAGYLTEWSVMLNNVTFMEQIPYKYWTSWKPHDTRKYVLQWHITDVKDIDVPNGNYSDCNYYFGDVKIDITDCEKMDYVEIENKTIDVYFKPMRGNQNLTLRIYDPLRIEYTEKDIIKSIDVYQKGGEVCVKRLIRNPTTQRIVLSMTKQEILPAKEEYSENCFKRKYLLDPYDINDAIDAAGMKDIGKIKEKITTFRFNTNDEGLIVR